MNQNELVNFVQKLLLDSRARAAQENVSSSIGGSASHQMIDDQIRSLMEQNDPVALALIFESYGANIYGTLIHILKTEEAAKNAIPDVFEDMWKRKLRIESREKPLLPWLVGFTIRCAVKKMGYENTELYDMLY